MATKRIEITNDWVCLNDDNGFVGSSFVLKLTEGTVFIGTTSDNNNPPEEQNCYRESEGIVYGGTDYVWAKSISPQSAFGIMDS